MLLNGLVPALGEALEAVVHYVESGHIAHLTQGETDLGDLGQEHGCGPTSHHCGCCASQPVLAAGTQRLASLAVPVGEPVVSEGLRYVEGARARLFRPPILA